MTADSYAVETALADLGGKAVPMAQLGARTTYRVGGTAAVGYTVQDTDDLRRLAEVAQRTSLPVLFVGLGSNMLVADTGFNGIAVHLGERFAQIDWTSDWTSDWISRVETAKALTRPQRQDGVPDGVPVMVKAGAAVPLPVLARQCAARALGGMGWAVGVPGSVGGAVRMNAGGHGSDIASRILSATVFDLSNSQTTDWDAKQLNFKYRNSAIEPHQVVISASFMCEHVAAEQAQQELKEIVAWRRQNQPGGQNAGSVFKNPPAQSAGALIDRLGLKGLRVGCAHVSQVHANFIVADPNGKATDVAELIDLVSQRVYESTGVCLSTEVHFVGFADR